MYVAFVCIVRRFYLFFFLQPNRSTNVLYYIIWVPSYDDGGEGEGAIMGFYKNILYIYRIITRRRIKY